MGKPNVQQATTANIRFLPRSGISDMLVPEWRITYTPMVGINSGCSTTEKNNGSFLKNMSENVRLFIITIHYW